MVAATAHPPVRTPFFYGYLVTAVCCLSMVCSVGMGFYSFSIFMAPLMAEFGWSAAQVTTAISFNIAAGFMAPFIGALIDRWGPRKVMLVFTPIVIASFFLRAVMTDLWQLYAIQVVSAIGHSGETGIALGLIMSQWFRRKRGRMMGIAMMGANIGGMVFSPLTSHLITAIGWRMTYVVFGVLVATIMLPAFWFLIRNAPEDVGLTPDGIPVEAPLPAATAALESDTAEWTGPQAMRTPAFWAVAAGMGAGIVGMTGVLLMEVPHLTAAVGLDAVTASYALGATAFFGMLGKIIFGYMTERTPARFAVMLALLYQAAGVAVLINVRGAWDLVLFAPIFGLGFGAIGALQPLIVGQTFGLRSFGTISGTLQIVTSLAAAIAPPLAGTIKDTTGSFSSAFALFTLVLLGGAVALLFARPPKAAHQMPAVSAAVPEASGVR